MPGPIGKPFIGSIDAFANYNKMKKIHDTYGKVVMLHYGMTNYVYINDLKLMKQLFKTKEFAKRKWRKTEQYLDLGKYTMNLFSLILNTGHVSRYKLTISKVCKSEIMTHVSNSSNLFHCDTFCDRFIFNTPNKRN